MIGSIGSSILQPPGGAFGASASRVRARGPRADGGANAGTSPGEVGPATAIGAGKGELTDEERRKVDALKRRDREVRRHEAAHKGAAGGNARGGPTFTFQTGSDGRRYAVEGEVQIDTSTVRGDPEATIRKMQQVARAARAPAHPSPQDQRVAAQAAAQEQRARAELARQKRDGDNDTGNPAGNTTAATSRTSGANGPTADGGPQPGSFIDVVG